MKLTYLLILAAIAVHIYIAFFASEPEAWYITFGFSGENLLARPYSLVTSIFLHGSFLHLLSNILVWLFFGMAVESELGRGKMLAIFFLGAFAGDFLSLLAYPWDAISVGASAGIFALVGVGMLVRPMDLSFYPLVIPVPLAFLGLLYAIFNTYEFLFAADPSISYIGHFGGLAVGLLFGVRYAGVKKSIKIILVTLAVMALIPFVWILLTR
mgnify:CR=1 FL=1